MTNDIDQRVAVIGLGAMGGAMAATLRKAGWTVTGFDPSNSARKNAESNGISTVSDLADLAGTPYIVLSLPSAKIVAITVPELLKAPGTISIVDTTTSEPEVSVAMDSLAREKGASFVDAPVSGGRIGASTGTLSAFIGSTDEALIAAEPLLMCLTGGNYDHVGGPGSGNVVKLLNNVLAATNLVAVGEALAVANKYGINLGTAAASISGASGGSRVSEQMYPSWILSGTHDSGFSLGLMARDASLAISIARESGESPDLLGTVNKQWQIALSTLGANADFTEIARLVAPTITTGQASNNSEND